MTSAKFLWLLRDFVPEYYRAKFVIGPQIKEKDNVPPPPTAYMVPKDPSLNRAKGCCFERNTYIKLLFKCLMEFIFDALIALMNSNM